MRRTILLVDDDSLLGPVRKSVLERQFAHVERVADAGEAFVRVEDPEFAASLSLVIVGLTRPGLGVQAFIEELTDRLPSIPLLILGLPNEAVTLHPTENIRFLGRAGRPEHVLAASRQILEPRLATA